MKPKLIHIAFILVFFMLSAAAKAYDPIVLHEEPQAYAPFTVEFLVSNDAYPKKDKPSVIDVTGNIITVEFLSDRVNFLAPMTYFEAEIQGLPAGEYKIVTSRRNSIGEVEKEDELLFTIHEAPPVEPVFAFFHSQKQHYFITIYEDERLSALANHWYPVDAGFNAWPADGPAPEEAVPVCRFYAPSVDSYFYTGDQEECEYLQSFDSGWEYEGIALQILMPINGACPSGTQPVRRLFNNRHMEQDSNHRFVASKETFRSMVASGWHGAGIGFCSPPQGAVDVLPEGLQ